MLPDFLCIGTYRAGTTWLWRNLKKHPEIFLPNEKELMFFSHNYDRGIEWYEKYFPQYTVKRIGEICPTYLSSGRTPERIKRHLPHVQFIVTLRDPVSQIVSAYNHRLTRGQTNKDLLSLLDEDKFLLKNVLYYKHLKRYFDYYDKNRFLILLYDELMVSPEDYLKKIYEFLNITPWYPLNISNKYNYSRQPRSQLIEKGIARTGKLLRKKRMHRIKSILQVFGVSEHIKMLNTRQNSNKSNKRNNDLLSTEIIEKINNYVFEDTENLQTFLNKDLSYWYK